MAPILCGSITTKQSLLGMGWTITSLISLIAFLTAAIMACIIFSNANRMARMHNYNQYNNYNNYNQYNYNNNYYWYYNNRNNNNQQNQGGGSADREGQMYQLLASASSYSIIFVGMYTAGLSLALTFFGGKCIVGFMSLEGNYIPPTWTGTENQKVNKKYFGIFVGMLIFISNLFLVVAVILGEFQMGGRDERQREEIGSFAIEKTAGVLGTIFMSLALTYFLYSIILFSFKDEILHEGAKKKRGYRSPRPVLA